MQQPALPWVCATTTSWTTSRPPTAPRVLRAASSPASCRSFTLHGGDPRITHGVRFPLSRHEFIGTAASRSIPPSATAPVFSLWQTVPAWRLPPTLRSRYARVARQHSLGNTVASGSFPHASRGDTTTPSVVLDGGGLLSAVSRRLPSRRQCPTAGTRPTALRPSVSLPNGDGKSAHTDLCTSGAASLFGMAKVSTGCTAMLNALGISSTIDDRELSTTEPNGPTPGRATARPPTRVIRPARACGWCGSTHSYWDARRRDHRQCLSADEIKRVYQTYMSQVFLLKRSDAPEIPCLRWPNITTRYLGAGPDLAGYNANFVQRLIWCNAGLHATDRTRCHGVPPALFRR